MADKPTTKPAPEMVEVRLLAPQLQQEMPDGSIKLRRRGETFSIERRLYEADIVPMGLKPPRSRTFTLIADEKAAEAKKADAAQGVQDRIARMRESVRDTEQATEQARANARVMEAENAKALAAALKPMERPGAVRVG